MTVQGEELLRQSLDSVDRLKKRWTIVVWGTVALAQLAWLALVFGLEKASMKETLILITLALAMCVFGGVFMLVLHITRMTQQVLRAIEAASKS